MINRIYVVDHLDFFFKRSFCFQFQVMLENATLVIQYKIQTKTATTLQTTRRMNVCQTNLAAPK